MSVDDHGLEVLKKAAEPLDPLQPKTEYVLRTKVTSSALPLGASTLAEQQTQTGILNALGVILTNILSTLGLINNKINTKTTHPAEADSGIVVRNIPLKKVTYSAAVLGLIPAATPTDILTIEGATGKLVRVKKISITGTQTNGSFKDVILVKRSTLNAGGTFTSAPLVPHDSANAAATAVVRAYTANPTALGTLVGFVRALKLVVPKTNDMVDPLEFLAFGDDDSEAIRLRENEALSINLNGSTTAGGNFNISVEITEEGV